MEVNQKRLDTINDLIRLGVPKTKIAKKIGVSRTRLYEILDEQRARTKPNKK